MAIAEYKPADLKAISPSYLYAEFGYVENGVFYKSKGIKANWNTSGVLGLPDEEAWKAYQKYGFGRSWDSNDHYIGMEEQTQGKSMEKIKPALYKRSQSQKSKENPLILPFKY